MKAWMIAIAFVLAWLLVLSEALAVALAIGHSR